MRETTIDKRKALGRGLSALIPGAHSSITPLRRDFFQCAIEDVHPSVDNPRRSFDGARLQELADSIRTQGLVQPLVVRARPESEGGGFTLIAGERRWRAAQLAGQKNIPVVVKETSAAQSFELALVENLQREDLNPIEEAEAFERLLSEFKYTQEEVAKRVGKERATISNALRLLKLPISVRHQVASGELPMGHARALLALESSSAIEAGALRVIAKQWSARQTEQWIRQTQQGPSRTTAPTQSAAVRDLQNRLERALGTKVRLEQKDKQRGAIVIDYHSLDQLDTLLGKLLRS